MLTVENRCSYLFCFIWAILGLTNGATNCIVQSGGNIKHIICNVTENVPEGTIVFNVTEIDPRYVSNLRYVVRFSPNNVELHFRRHFDINTTFALSTLRNGLIRTQGDFDREDMFLSSGNSREQITWSLFLVVSVPESTLYQLLINVVDINDNVPKFSSAMYHVSGVEGDQQNANLGEPLIGARDPDQEHNAVQEYFLEDDLEGLFTLGVTLVGDIDAISPVNEDVVRLESTRPLDREERASYNLVLIARDGGNMTGRLNINLTVSDVNDNNPVVPQTSYPVIIEENSTAIQHVIDINATDMDSGINGALTYSFSEITGDNGERVSGDIFSINTSTGEVRTSAVLDRETDSRYHLIVEVRDGGNPLRNVFVTVNVQIEDVNDNPPNVRIDANQLTSGKVSENLNVGIAIATMTVTDPDEGTNGLFGISQWRDLNNDNDEIRSQIEFRQNMPQNNTWDLILLTRLDRETRDHYDIQVTVTDRGIRTLSTVFNYSFSIHDENDNAPIFNTSYIVSVSEGTGIGETVVPNIRAYDRDIGTNANLTYSLSPTSENFQHQHLFSIHHIVGNLIVEASLDRESTPVLDIEVVATDMGGTPMSGQTSVRLVLTDVNDNAPMFAPDTTSQIGVQENLPARHIYTFSATDQDLPPYANVTYSIDPANDFFQIESRTGKLNTTRPLNREEFANHSIRIVASDDELDSAVIVTIVVGDVNDVHPRFDRETYWKTIPENASISTVLTVLTVIDPDIDNALQFSIVSGNDERKFSVNPTGEIIVASMLDRETTENYTLIVRVTDNSVVHGGDPVAPNRTRVVITVSDINDHDPEFNQSSYEFYVVEESETATDVGAVLAISNDAGQNAIISYEITRGNDGGHFTINSSSGVITARQGIDRESNEMFELSVTARDGGQPPLYNTTDVTVWVRDINDNSPTFDPANVTIFLREDHSLNQSFYTANAVDTDEGSNANTVYSITSASYGNFSINPSTGSIVLLSTLDYEVLTSIVVVIQAVDSQQSDFTSLLYLNISVLDIDDRLPRFPSDFPTTQRVNESAPAGSVILYFQAVTSSISLASHFNYVLANHLDDFTLSISNHIASLEVVSLDRELRSQYNLNITINNTEANLSNSKILTIVITDANDNSPVFISSPYSFNVEENSVGAHVGTVSADDEDDGVNSMVLFTLQDGADLFKINNETGEILTATSLDYDTVRQHSLVVWARDMGIPSRSTSTTISISVTDINDNPPEFSINQEYHFVVSEDASIGTPVGNIEASDIDSGEFGTITYAIQTGDDENHFRIVQEGSRGTMVVNRMLDRESVREYSLVVSVSDNNNHPHFHRIQRNFTITVQDINDNAPVFSNMQVYTAMVPENGPATSIANISTTDADSGINARVSYMLGSGNYNKSFLIDSSTGELRVIRSLDYEMNTFYPLEVIAVDNGSPVQRSVQIFNITVTNVNDHTPEFTLPLYQFTVKEHSTSASMMRVLAEDSDSGLMGEVTYRILTQSPPGYFTIDGATGSIRPIRMLDYEQFSEYKLIVEATDRDPMVANRRRSEADVLIVLENINDNEPSFLNLPHTIRLSEAVSTSTVAYVASAVDADTDTLRYSIAGGNQGNKFLMNPQTGEVSVSSSLDRDDVLRYVLTIHVTDGSNIDDGLLTIVVEDVNDNSPVFARSPYTVNMSEDSRVGDVVGRVDATDADEGFNGRLEYSLVEASEYFSIDSSSGNLTLLVPLDRDSNSTPNVITLQVKVTDMGIINRNANTTSVQVLITDVNDNPPIFTKPVYRFTISRDLSVGSTIGVIDATDADEGTNAQHLFNIDLIPVGQTLFSLNSSSGELTLQNSLMGSLPFYRIRVRVVDLLRNQVFENFASVEIIVTDTNDHPPVFPKEKYPITLIESAVTPMNILKLTATDDDTGSNGEIMYRFAEAQSHFTINQSSGNITLTDSLDHERISFFNLLVYAINRNGRNSSTTVNINVMDVNDNIPQFQSLSASLTISEVPYRGLEILRVNATDPDGSIFGEVSYRLITARGQFTINNVTGIVTNLVELTATSNYTLEFEATDGGGSAASRTMVLTVENHSTQSPNFGTPSGSLTVREDFPINITFYQFNASNRLGSSLPIKYRISNFTDEMFALNETTGELALLRSLDFEQVEAYHFVIESYQETSITRYSSYFEVAIVVEDENDNAPVFTDTYVVPPSISESIAIDGKVANVHAEDEDTENNYGRVTYKITGGNIGDVFSIGPTDGEIVVVSSLDRESVDTYRLIITATDEGTPPLSATAVVAVSVADVNDVTPQFRNASYLFRVYENATGSSLIGVVSAVDPDLTNNQLRYNLQSLTASSVGRSVPDIPLTYFEVDGSSGAIRLNHNLNRASVDRYELNITVSDGRNGNHTIVAIIVQDSNDNRPLFDEALYTFNIPELSVTGTPVFQLIASDDDIGRNGIVRYQLKDDWPTGVFTINPLTGIVTLLESAPLYQTSRNGVWATGTVVAHDLGSVPQSSSATVTINLFDVNNHPPSLTSDYSPSIFTMYEIGRVVLNITATDQDQGSNAQTSYYISYPQGPVLIPFEIDPTTGSIAVSGELSPGKVTFTVIAINENPSPFASQFILSSTATVEITVNAMNMYHPRFNRSHYEGQVLESEDPGTNIVQVYATDNDGNTISYSIQSPSNVPFGIDANGLISITDTLDREETNLYNIVIVATDNGEPPKSDTTTVRISVIDVNDNPPLFDKQLFEVSVIENVDSGTEVTTITATDGDVLENARVTYEINDTTVFRIDPSTGLIITISEIDREAVAMYHLEILASDGGNPTQSSSAIVLISVEGENEFEPFFDPDQKTVFMVKSGLSAGSWVGKLNAYDGDLGSEGELKFTFFGFGADDPNEYFYINSSGFIILNVTSQSNTVSTGNTITASRGRRQAADPTADNVPIETGVRAEDSGANPRSVETRITLFLPREYIPSSPVLEHSPTSSSIVVVAAAVCSAVVVAVIVFIISCFVYRYRRRGRNKLYSPSPLSETESRPPSGSFTSSNGVIHNDSRSEVTGTRLTAIPEAVHGQISTTSDSEPASGIFGDDESESVSGMQSRARANNPEHVSPSGRHRSPQHSRPPPISRSTSDLAAVVNGHNPNGFLRRQDDEEAHPYTRDQLIAIYAANANLLTNSPSQDSMHMFGSEGGGEADGDIDMDNYMFAKFSGGLDSADEESVVGINNDAYTVSSRGRSSIASRSSGGGIDEGAPEDLWRGSRTSGFRPHRVTDVIDEMQDALSQESLSQSKEKRKPKPLQHIMQFQETSFMKKPSSNSYTRYTGSMQNVRYPDHVGNSQYEAYDGRRSSKSQSQSHYASSGAIYPLSYCSRASEITLPPYRAGEAPPPYGNELSPPMRPVNPTEMRRDSQSSDSDSSEYPAPNPTVTSYGPQPISPQPSLPTTNSTISLDNPMFHSPLYNKHYKTAKAAIPHPHSGSVPQINMYNAGSVHGSIGQGMDRQQRYNMNNGNLRA